MHQLILSVNLNEYKLMIFESEISKYWLAFKCMRTGISMFVRASSIMIWNVKLSVIFVMKDLHSRSSRRGFLQVMNNNDKALWKNAGRMSDVSPKISLHDPRSQGRWRDIDTLSLEPNDCVCDPVCRCVWLGSWSGICDLVIDFELTGCCCHGSTSTVGAPNRVMRDASDWRRKNCQLVSSTPTVIT